MATRDNLRDAMNNYDLPKVILSLLICILQPLLLSAQTSFPTAWIRINQMGYRTDQPKVAVWCSKEERALTRFEVVDVSDQRTVFTSEAGESFGPYGPFGQTYRLNFTAFTKPGRYIIRAGQVTSPEFEIGENVYDGAADFCLRYMRQQRTGFNPFLKDSCHTHDGYTLYAANAGLPDSTHIDVVGGWHDASDYLQYSSTSSNATYHLLAAYRDFPEVFGDTKQANGLDGNNGIADVLDEAKWGLDWLLKMHPADSLMFNQIADDRDHISMRIPKQDSVYGRGYERPVYFINGEPQIRGKFLNNTKGTSSTAGKFSSAFSLGAGQFFHIDKDFSERLTKKSKTAYSYAMIKPGVTQTASVKAPYIYAEDNWVDDMELAASSQGLLSDAIQYANREPLTPWLGADTANHYQWYPFINLGHYELSKQLHGERREKIIDYYRQGIQKVLEKARDNAFLRGVPFIWCSNNLTVAFAIQCYWYRQLTGDDQFVELEQACFDWIFGCNPWGTSMVYGLPAHGDTPVDPHSSFTHLGNYPIDGGLVDGPVYTSIFNNLIGITLYNPDEYEAFQSDLAVYHDDYGDYSTNEPTMDGTASLVYLLAAKEGEQKKSPYQEEFGAYTRGNPDKKSIALVFTGDEYHEGLPLIIDVLSKNRIKGSFFFTGRLYENKIVERHIQQLLTDNHYLGPHSDQHLLYCDWQKRDSLLVSKDSMIADLKSNYLKMQAHGINVSDRFFIPPYEWWNNSIATWCQEYSIQLVNFTGGIPTNADYTYPEMGSSYQSTRSIVNRLFEKEAREGLNGNIILIHVGTDPRRKDKLYDQLSSIITRLRKKGYDFRRIDDMFARN